MLLLLSLLSLSFCGVSLLYMLAGMVSSLMYVYITLLHVYNNSSQVLFQTLLKERTQGSGVRTTHSVKLLLQTVSRMDWSLPAFCLLY